MSTRITSQLHHIGLADGGFSSLLWRINSCLCMVGELPEYANTLGNAANIVVTPAGSQTNVISFCGFSAIPLDPMEFAGSFTGVIKEMSYYNNNYDVHRPLNFMYNQCPEWNNKIWHSQCFYQIVHLKIFYIYKFSWSACS